jgi:hypothetical protein
VESTNVFDLVAGGVAVALLISGLVMLFQGVSAFEDKGK